MSIKSMCIVNVPTHDPLSANHSSAIFLPNGSYAEGSNRHCLTVRLSCCGYFNKYKLCSFHRTVVHSSDPGFSKPKVVRKYGTSSTQWGVTQGRLEKIANLQRHCTIYKKLYKLLRKVRTYQTVSFLMILSDHPTRVSMTQYFPKTNI